MSARTIADRALEQGQGIVRLVPNWVPRCFRIPGRRIKLHPEDYYALGMNRGGIDERWFASTTPADSGPSMQSMDTFAQAYDCFVSFGLSERDDERGYFQNGKRA